MMIKYGMAVPSDIHIIRSGSKHYSRETVRDPLSGETKPLLELTDVAEQTLCLSFVRAGAGFRLGSLLATAISYARANGYRRIELEDDAFFVTPCPHRALFRRAFEGKPGIYESRGWRPLCDTGPFISVLVSYTIAQAGELQGLMKEATRGPRSPRGIGSPASPTIPNDNGLFGVWINGQSNRVMRYYYNTLLVLSTPHWRLRIGNRVSPATLAFLQALHDLRMANKKLVMDL
jgi:hypothetical protein